MNASVSNGGAASDQGQNDGSTDLVGYIGSLDRRHMEGSKQIEPG